MSAPVNELLWFRDERTDKAHLVPLEVEHDGTPRGRRIAVARAVHEAMAVQVQIVRGTDGNPMPLVTAPNTAPVELQWYANGGAAVVLGERWPRHAGDVIRQGAQ